MGTVVITEKQRKIIERQRLKGTGSNPDGHRWLMKTRGATGGLWITRKQYTLAEVASWDFAYPVEKYEEPHGAD